MDNLRDDYLQDDTYQDDRDLGQRGDENVGKGGMDKVTGKVQEGWGKLTGNPQTEAEGKMRQAKGNLQEGFGNTERHLDSLDDSPDDMRDDEYERDTTI